MPYDLIIHFGFACFTEIEEQTLYVLPTLTIPDREGVQSLLSTLDRDWYVMSIGIIYVY
jgi:hypothetical protein